jgi:hypothetical protein
MSRPRGGLLALRALLVLALGLAAVAFRPAAAGTPALVTPLRITIIGDSLTQQYGPVLQELGREHGFAVRGRWYGGTNPIDHPWSTWVRAWSGVDYVVLEDVYLPDDTPHTNAEYLAAWQELVDAARTTLRPGGQVVVMNGNHPELSSIRGVDRFVDQVPPDSKDGIHWTKSGYTSEAILLCTQLTRSDSCA